MLAKKHNMNSRYHILLAGNPNVGKSTIFNYLTGLKQHTGNWAGKTVELSTGYFTHKESSFEVTDLPGSYSIFYDSKEEAVAVNNIYQDNFDVLVIVTDATALERNLCYCIQLLTITHKALLCLNMNDAAEKENIIIDTEELSLQLGIPIVTTSANKRKGLINLKNTIYSVSSGKTKTYEIQSIRSLAKIKDKSKFIESINNKCNEICSLTVKKLSHRESKTTKFDKILTNKFSGTIIILLIFAVLFWLTSTGANYPSNLLNNVFAYLSQNIKILLTDLKLPHFIISLLCDGIITTVSWVVSVMLPPSLIFFSLFALLEDFGLLPRIAFNMDTLFKHSGVSGKQALTMLMGFGCNACGVTGCRIIGNTSQRKIAIITNSFIPCNGRIPTLIALSSIFFASALPFISTSFISTITLIILLILAFAATLLASKILSYFLETKESSHFIMELPSYKKPQFVRTIVLTIKNKVLHVLGRAVIVAIPAGIVLWLLANTSYNGQTLLNITTNFFDPFAKAIGIDGTILTAFILGFPANEIVIPIMIMSYTSATALTDVSTVSALGDIFASTGWNLTTAICTMVLCLFHFPCSTTCITIYKETKSILTTMLSILVPLLIGFALCFIINLFSIFIRLL